MKTSKQLARIVALTMALTSSAAEPMPAIPIQAKLIVSISPITNPSNFAEPVRGLAQSLSGACTFFTGDQASAIERIVIVATEEFPKGTLIIIQGRFDLAKIQTRWQNLVATRQSNLRLQTEGGKNLFTLDTPNAIRAIPGIADTAYLTAANANTIIAAFEKEPLNAAVNRSSQAGNSNASVTSLLARLDPRADISFAADVPAILAAPQAALAGVSQAQGVLHLQNSVRGQGTLTLADTASARGLSNRLNEGLSHVQQLLPAMTSTVTDKTLVSWLSKALNATKIEAQSEIVVIKLELPGDSNR